MNIANQHASMISPSHIKRQGYPRSTAIHHLPELRPGGLFAFGEKMGDQAVDHFPPKVAKRPPWLRQLDPQIHAGPFRVPSSGAKNGRDGRLPPQSWEGSTFPPPREKKLLLPPSLPGKVQPSAFSPPPLQKRKSSPFFLPSAQTPRRRARRPGFGGRAAASGAASRTTEPRAPGDVWADGFYGPPEPKRLGGEICEALLKVTHF